MPVLESEMSREVMQDRVRKGYVCSECGGNLTVAWGGSSGHNCWILRCGKSIQHTGIAREAQLSRLDTPDDMQIGNLSRVRNEKLAAEIGTEKANALAIYNGKGQLTQVQAKEIILTIWPGAPAVEVTKAAMVCAQYGLNPLMKHLYLIPFDKKKKNDKTGKWEVESTSYAMVMGIKASRIIARRKGEYAYLDDTPRIMTEAEQIKIFGEVDQDNICAITRLKDRKGNSAIGTGKWPRMKKDYNGNLTENQPQGSDKGNTKLNMAMIRSERQALERLFPDSLPSEASEVADERYIELPDGDKVDTATGEIEDKAEAIEGEFTEETITGEVKTMPGMTVKESNINTEWLKTSLKTLNWNCLAWIQDNLDIHVDKISDAVSQMTPEQQEKFVNEINERLTMKGVK